MSAIRRRPLLSRRGRGDRGAAAIEFALVFPLFVMLTFGMISAGFAFYYDIQLTQAARDAARFGSTYDLQNDLDAGLAYMAEIAASQAGWSGVDGVPNDGSLVCVAYIGPTINKSLAYPGAVSSTAPCFDEGQPPPKVQVRIVRPSQLNAVLFSWNLNLASRAVIPHEQRSTS